LHAWRWIAALGSTTLSLSAFAVTLTLARGVTAIWENNALPGFQHFVQPQTWLKAACPLIETVTLLVEHLQESVPPAKFAAAGLRPPSTDGWIERAIFSFLLFLTTFAGQPAPPLASRIVNLMNPRRNSRNRDRQSCGPCLA
jgi:hypothetical protein